MYVYVRVCMMCTEESWQGDIEWWSVHVQNTFDQFLRI